MIKKLSIVFLFVVSLIGNSVCLAENTNQKDMSIILAEDAGFKFDLFFTPDKNNGAEAVVSLIDKASVNIKIAMYRINSKKIIDSLERAVKRGVKVSVMLNPKDFSSNYEYKTIERSFEKLKTTNKKSSVELQDIGVQLIYPDSSQYYLYHLKFILIDDKLLWFGTLNFTDNGFENDRNFFLTSEDSQILKDFLCIWKMDSSKSLICPVSSQVILGPVGQRKKIVDLLYSARSSIRIYMPSIEDLGIGTSLLQMAEKNVKIEIVATAGHTENKFSEAIHKVLNSSSNITVFNQKNPPVHAKAILVDYGTKDAKLYLGTCNMFHSSLDLSREVGLVITDRNTIQSFFNVFQEDVAKHE